MKDMLNSAGRVVAVWRKVIGLLRRYPVIAVPFVVIGFVDMLLLSTLLIMVLLPWSTVVVPVVDALWGEEYLRYPMNIYLLPKIFSFARNITGLFFGVVLSAMTITMIHQAVQGSAPAWRPALRRGMQKYARFAALWAIALGLAVLAMRLMEQVYVLANSYEARGIAGFMAVMVIQMVLFFALPAVGVENRKISAALRRSIRLLKSYPAETAVLVLVPNLLVIPLIYAYTNVRFLIERTWPEAVIVLMLARIVILLVVNFAVVSSATVLLLSHRRMETTVNT